MSKQLLLILSVFWTVSFASPPDCAPIVSESAEKASGTWQGLILGRHFFESPFHLELDEECLEDGGCLLIWGFHDSVDSIYRSLGPVKHLSDEGLQLQFAGDRTTVIIEARFTRCSPVSGELNGVIYLEEDPIDVRHRIVGMRYKKTLFDLLSEFNEEVKGIRPDRESDN